MLTGDEASSFVQESWGSELQKEWADSIPDFVFAHSETPMADLLKSHDEQAAKGKKSRHYNTGVFPGDPDMPADLSHALEKTRNDIVRLSRAGAAKGVLDWPTGWGYCLHYLAEQVDPSATVAAVDISFRTLAWIKPYYEKHGLADRILFVVADARNMPFRDGVFQSATAWGGTCEIENTAAGFRETFRVLESGGWFGVSGDQYKEGSPSMEIADRIGLSSLVTRERLEATMGSLGFRNCQYEIAWEGYDCWEDLPDEDRCPLPARGDWYQNIVACGQK